MSFTWSNAYVEKALANRDDRIKALEESVEAHKVRIAELEAHFHARVIAEAEAARLREALNLWQESGCFTVQQRKARLAGAEALAGGIASAEVAPLLEGSIVCPFCHAHLAWGGERPADCLGCGEALAGRMDKDAAAKWPEDHIAALIAAGDRLMFVLDHCELWWTQDRDKVTLDDVQAAKREWLRAKDGEDPEADRGVNAGGSEGET